ncbi:MAG: SWIM zinc finger family protein [Bacteroidota bacterium]
MHLVHTLRQLATSQSFQRGEDYFESGLVSKLIKKGHEYEGEVEGSRKYRQHINTKNGFEGSCTCPYDFGGICKHLVAVGLAIENEEFTEVLQVEEEIDASIEQELFFTEVYEQVETGEKLSFLRKLLEKNNQLRGQFAAFVSQHKQHIRTINLHQIRDQMIDRIGESDFSFDALMERGKYEDEGGYYEEDAIEDGLEEVLEDIFRPFVHKLEACLKAGNLQDALRILLGVYEGMYLFDEAPGDEDGYIEDFQEELRSVYIEGLDSFMTYLEAAVVATASLKDLQDLFFARWDHYEKIYDYNDPQSSIRYDLSLFTPLLLSLASDAVSVHYLDLRVTTYGLAGTPGTAHLLLGIAKRQGNEAKWTELAETHSETYLDIGQELLESYQASDNSEAFAKLAKRMYRVYGRKIGAYLLDNLDPEEAPLLYKQVLTDQLERTADISLYKKWRSLASEQEQEAYLQSLRANFTLTSFYIQVLEVEGRLDEILDLARKEYAKEFSTFYFDPGMVLKPILTYDPEFCFHLLADIVAQKIAKDRGRTAYKKICEWLQLMKQIPGFESQARIVIQECYKQRLPALKDEMRRAGLL